MKTTQRNGQQGTALLVAIVLLALLLFLGYTMWQIWKMIKKLPPLPSKSRVAFVVMPTRLQAAHAEAVTTQTLTATTVQPFYAPALIERIWRSTNLVNWECIATNLEGQAWADTNAPWPCGFYKREIMAQ